MKTVGIFGKKDNKEVLAVKGKLEEHESQSGDIVVFASIGAGMNVNSLVYKLE